MSRLKEITSTTLVYEALIKADDFRTARQLQAETSQSPNRVSAALYGLLRYGAVDLIEAPETLWWFATPDGDTRCRTVEERTPESKLRDVRGRLGKKRGPHKHGRRKN